MIGPIYLSTLKILKYIRLKNTVIRFVIYNFKFLLTVCSWKNCSDLRSLQYNIMSYFTI